MRWWRLLHWVLIVGLLQEVLYGGYMVFFVVGGGGPLFARAGEVSFELLVTRRLYAIETWVAAVGLALYLGLTEILPRQLGRRDEKGQ